MGKLRIKVRTTCRSCDGDGKKKFVGGVYLICPRCKGDGYEEEEIEVEDENRNQKSK